VLFLLLPLERGAKPLDPVPVGAVGLLHHVMLPFDDDVPAVGGAGHDVITNRL
jgi:hypothetical protein